MAITPIPLFQAGIRMFDGGDLNRLVNAINQGLMNWPQNVWYVGAGSNRNGRDWAGAFTTLQSAVNAAANGDLVLVSQGAYEEEVTIDVPNLTIAAIGGRGSVAVEAQTTNSSGITINDVDGVNLVNIGSAGDGTGYGLKVLGDCARTTVLGGKFESGAAAIRLESDAGGAVADTRIIGAELCWATAGLSIDSSGGGDPVTQTLLQNCLLQNITTDGVLVGAVHTADLWVLQNIFANQEDATEPTQYIDADTANTTGLIAGNFFATTVLASAKLAIAAGVIWAGNQCQAEGPATGGGTAGRPD